MKTDSETVFQVLKRTKTVYSPFRALVRQELIFVLKDTKEPPGNQLSLSTDHQVTLPPCVEGITLDPFVLIVICYDVYRIVRDHVRRFFDLFAFEMTALMKIILTSL